MMKRTKRVIITVPHGYCTDKIRRTCDKRANDAAEVLRSELMKKNINVDVYFSEIERRAYDLNRSNNRLHDWRIRLYEFMKQVSKTEDIYHIDMHSFVAHIYDPSTLVTKTITNYGKKYNMVIVYDDKTNNRKTQEDIVFASKITNSINTLLSKKTLVIKTDDKITDIIKQNRAFTKCSILIENNENKELYNDEIMKKYMEHIANVIARN